MKGAYDGGIRDIGLELAAVQSYELMDSSYLSRGSHLLATSMCHTTFWLMSVLHQIGDWRCLVEIALGRYLLHSWEWLLLLRVLLLEPSRLILLCSVVLSAYNCKLRLCARLRFGCWLVGQLMSFSFLAGLSSRGREWYTDLLAWLEPLLDVLQLVLHSALPHMAYST